MNMNFHNLRKSFVFSEQLDLKKEKEKRPVAHITHLSNRSNNSYHINLMDYIKFRSKSSLKKYSNLSSIFLYLINTELLLF